MSLVISSTTDSQEDVNAAAGIADSGEAETTDSTTPTPVPAPAEEPKEDGDENDEEEPVEDPDETQDKPKRKGGFQRKIENLERQNGHAQRQIEELRSMLAGQRKPAGEIPQQPQGPKARPSQDDYQSFEAYFEALSDWKTETKLQERERELARQAREWHAQEQQRQLMSGWEQRVGEFRSKAEDFDDVLAATQHIAIPQDILRALVESENGPQLAYELARQPKELERIAKIQSPLAAVRELGKFEARISAQAEAPKRAAPMSKAPEPIKPVGQGAATSTKNPDEMSFQEYKRYREAEIAARKRRSA